MATLLETGHTADASSAASLAARLRRRLRKTLIAHA
jgi:hypothetical protein